MISLILANPLDIFEPYMGLIWEGHFIESSDSLLTQFIYWEYALDSSRVYQIKTIPEVSFKMVTTYYMDEHWQELALLTILDEDTYAVGYAHKEAVHIEAYSKNYHEKGSHETISHYQLWQGKLIERFYRKREGFWYLENTVLYKPILLSEAFTKMKE
jgi:hypothetical protein